MAPKLSIDIYADAADLLTQPISISASGINRIVSGAGGQIIRVYRLALLSSAANNLTFQSGSNSLSGAIPFAANQGLILTFDTKPWYVTTAGNDFNIMLSAASLVGGILYYTTEGSMGTGAKGGLLLEDAQSHVLLEDGTDKLLLEQ